METDIATAAKPIGNCEMSTAADVSIETLEEMEQSMAAAVKKRKLATAATKKR